MLNFLNVIRKSVWLLTILFTGVAIVFPELINWFALVIAPPWTTFNNVKIGNKTFGLIIVAAKAKGICFIMSWLIIFFKLRLWIKERLKKRKKR